MASQDRIQISQEATASWTVDSQHHKLDGFKLRLSFDPSTKTAFLRLRITLHFKADVAAGRDTVPKAAWLFIAPERIKQLVPHYEDGAACLHLSLNRPPQLVMPPNDDLSLHESYNKTWATLKSLATMMGFSISLPASCIPRAGLLLLCAAISEGGLTTDKRAAETSSFYGGKGGQVIEGDSLSLDVPAVSPPLHHQVIPSPPSRAIPEEPSKKRRRVSAEAGGPPMKLRQTRSFEEIEPQFRAEPRRQLMDEDFSRLGVESRKRLKDELMAELGAELRAELKKQLKDELLAELGAGSREQLKNELLTELRGQMEEEVSAKCRVMKAKLKDQLDTKIELGMDDMKRENEVAIFAEIETQIDADMRSLEEGISDKMEEVETLIKWVKGRMKQAKTRMRQVETLAEQVETIAEQVKTLAVQVQALTDGRRQGSKEHIEDQIIDTVKKAVISMQFEFK